MKRSILFAALVTGLLSSCSTAFKAGQTPDDLYYSPGRDVAVVREEKRQKSQEDDGEYQEYVSSSDDRYLHMRTANRARWTQLDNFSYWNDSRYDFNSYSYYNSYSVFNRWGFFDPYAFGYSGINPYYGNIGLAGYGGYGGWGYGSYGGYSNFGWNNPAYTLIYYGTPKFTGGTTSPTSGISAYRNKSYNNTNDGYIINPRTGAGSQTSFGNLVKRVFTGSAANNTLSSFDRPTRSFSTTPANSNATSVPAPSSSAGGNSGGFKSTGTTTTTGRGGKN